jgi:hypothetical protein
MPLDPLFPRGRANTDIECDVAAVFDAEVRQGGVPQEFAIPRIAGFQLNDRNQRSVKTIFWVFIDALVAS